MQIATPAMSLAAAALSAPAAAVSEAFVEAIHDVTPYLHRVGHELVGVDVLRKPLPKDIASEAFPWNRTRS